MWSYGYTMIGYMIIIIMSDTVKGTQSDGPEMHKLQNSIANKVDNDFVQVEDANQLLCMLLGRDEIFFYLFIFRVASPQGCAFLSASTEELVRNFDSIPILFF